jgi:hypothetical protein
MSTATSDLLAVTPSGEVHHCTVSVGDSPGTTSMSLLHSLYRIIGCSTVDAVGLTPEIDTWVDGEGRLRAWLVNQVASYIATRLGRPFQLYVGAAVFTGGPRHSRRHPDARHAARQALLDLIHELRGTP